MNRPNRKQIASLALIAAGLAMIAYWLRLQGMNRTHAEDNMAWCVFSIGAAMAGAGISMPSLRPRYVLLIALASPFALYVAIAVLIWGSIVIYALFYYAALWVYQP